MKTVKIVPSLCKQEGSAWEGHVIMRLPSFDEKMEYIQELGEDIDADGEVGSVKKESPVAKIKQIRKMVAVSAKHYQEVHLKDKTTGLLVQSFDEMQYLEELHSVLIELSGKLVEGFKVGNG